MQELLGHEVELSAVEDSIIKNFVNVFEIQIFSVPAKEFV
jgi:hypothetical protein